MREVHALILKTIFATDFCLSLKYIFCDLIVDLILAPGIQMSTWISQALLEHNAGVKDHN